MDLLFHAVVGAAIGECAPKRIQHRQLKGVAGALLPDLANLPSYLYLGMKTNSTLWYPTPEAFYNNEWIVNHPTWAVWYLSHSLLFWAIVVVPLFRYAKWEHLLSIAYLSHLLLDLPSHTGIWGMAPFWPHPMLVDGWFDAWAWGPGTIFTYALIPAALWALARTMDVSAWWTKDSTATQAS